MGKQSRRQGRCSAKGNAKGQRRKRREHVRCGGEIKACEVSVARPDQEGPSMKAIIMAGGQGTRLRPLTSDQPKPMIPIVNAPCMEHIVRLLERHGFTDIAVTLQFMPDEIRDYFGDGSEWNVNIRYSV